MTARHLEFLVEEPSMEAFLKGALPRLLQDCTFQTHAFQGKRDLLRKLPFRLRGYGHWLSDDQRIVVVVDRDSDECRALKQRLEEAAAAAGLRTRSQTGDGCWQVVNRIVIEELEAWYFGDWEAVRGAYPKVSPTIPNQARYGVPDAIRGGTWEAFERILQAPRLLQDWIAQGRSGENGRRPYRPGPQPVREFPGLPRCACRGRFVSPALHEARDLAMAFEARGVDVTNHCEMP